MHEKARHAADDRADEKAVLELRARAGKAEHREREQIVADERLPRPGIRAAEHRLQNAVGKARKHTGAEAPAGAVQKDRQHLDRDRPALRELEKLEIAQDLGQGDEDRALAQRTQAQMGFALGHVVFLLKEKLHCRNNAVHRKR